MGSAGSRAPVLQVKESTDSQEDRAGDQTPMKAHGVRKREMKAEEETSQDTVTRKERSARKDLTMMDA